MLSNTCSNSFLLFFPKSGNSSSGDGASYPAALSSSSTLSFILRWAGVYSTTKSGKAAVLSDIFIIPLFSRAFSIAFASDVSAVSVSFWRISAIFIPARRANAL
jgi:hypothetical protein